MTRFEMEISGRLGEFWKKRAAEEVAEAVKKADEDATIEADGAIRWNSNGNYIPDDFCEKLEYAGFNFSREATRAKREVQTSKFIEQYIAKQTEPTAEDMNEMRAAFGEGATVVNLLSGRRYAL